MKSAKEIREFLDEMDNPVFVQEKKYPFSHRPFTYAIQNDYNRVTIAALPMLPDPKDAKAIARAVAEMVKMGYVVSTKGGAGTTIVRVNDQDYSEDKNDPKDKLVLIAELDCGCCVAFLDRTDTDLAGMAKVVQVWVENGWFIQTVPVSQVFIATRCPHKPPKKKKDEAQLSFIDQLKASDEESKEEEE